MAPRVAAEKPPTRGERAAHEALLPHCVARVLRTGRVVLAPRREERSERDPIEPDERDAEPVHQAACFVIASTSSTRSPSQSNPLAVTASGRPGRTINT